MRQAARSNLSELVLNVLFHCFSVCLIIFFVVVVVFVIVSQLRPAACKVAKENTLVIE